MDFKNYYEEQIGSGLPVYRGARFQRGHGLGSMFKRFFRWVSPLLKTHALPMLKESAQTLGHEAVKTVSNIANDAIMGKNIETAVTERAKEAVDSITDKAQQLLMKKQSGSGIKRKATPIEFTNSKKPRLVADIFNNI